MKKLLALIFCLASLSAYSVALASFNPAHSVNTLGLIGWWKMDEGVGTTTRDSSGNGNTGTFVNTPTWVAGKVGPRALSFDRNNGDRLTIPTTSALNAYPFTLSTWFKGTDTVQGGIVNKYVASSINGYNLYQDSGHARFWYFGSGGFSNCIYNASGDGLGLDGGVVNDGNWHYIAVVINATDGRIYVDGVLKDTLAWTGSPQATTTTADLMFSIYQPGAVLSSTLDDVRIYNRALSVAELTQLYNAQYSLHPNSTYANTLTAGLVGYWPFDGQYQTATVSTDVSGGGKTGTVTGATRIKGQLGQALFFDDSIPSNVKLPKDSNRVISSVPYSINAWIKPNDVGADTTGNGIFYQGDGSVVGIAGFLVLSTSGNNTLDFIDAAVGQLIPSGSPVTLGQWQMATATIDASGNQTIYLNGVSIGTRAGSANAPTNDFAYIGTWLDQSSARSFNGSIDDVRVYNTALSAGDVLQLYNQQHSLHANSSQTSTLTSGLVGMWDFNGNDTTATTATDGSGNGNTGTLTGGPVPKMGRIGQALSFPGASNNTNYVALTNKFNLGTGNFTVSFWGKLTKQANLSVVIGNGVGDIGAGADFNDNWMIYLASDGKLYLYTVESFNGTIANTTDDVSGAWHNFICVRNGTTMNIYVDGVIDGTVTDTVRNITSSTKTETIGRGFYYGGGWNDIQGLLDDVRIYNRALSADEVTKLYSYGK